MAFDIGTTYETPFDGIILGVSITNFGQKMQINGKDLTTTVDIDPSNNGNNGQINTRLETDEFDLPLMLRVGLAWQPIKSGKSTPPSWSTAPRRTIITKA